MSSARKAERPHLLELVLLCDLVFTGFGGLSVELLGGELWWCGLGGCLGRLGDGGVGYLEVEEGLLEAGHGWDDTRILGTKSEGSCAQSSTVCVRLE